MLIFAIFEHGLNNLFYNMCHIFYLLKQQ